MKMVVIAQEERCHADKQVRRVQKEGHSVIVTDETRYHVVDYSDKADAEEQVAGLTHGVCGIRVTSAFNKGSEVSEPLRSENRMIRLWVHPGPMSSVNTYRPCVCRKKSGSLHIGVVNVDDAALLVKCSYDDTLCDAGIQRGVVDVSSVPHHRRTSTCQVRSRAHLMGPSFLLEKSSASQDRAL